MNEELIRQCAREAAAKYWESIDAKEFADDCREGKDDEANEVQAACIAIRLYHARAVKSLVEAVIRMMKWVEPIAGDNSDAVAALEEHDSVSEVLKALAPFQQEGASDLAPQQPITPEVWALVEAAREAETYIRNWQQSPTSRRTVLGNLEKAFAPFQKENSND